MDQKQISRRVFEEAWNTGAVDVIDQHVAPDATVHDDSVLQFGSGASGLKNMVRAYRKAFPDVRIRVEQQIAEGDLVVTRWSATATHRGELMGIAPTQKSTRVTGINIDRYRDGKIVEYWGNWDALGLMQQIGVMPKMTGASPSPRTGDEPRA